MKKLLLITCIFIIQSISIGQISTKKMLYFRSDNNNQKLYIYDLKSKNLIKTIFIGEKSRFSTLNFDDSKLFIISKNFLNIIDIPTFEYNKHPLSLPLGFGITAHSMLIYYGGPFVDFAKRTITYIVQDFNKMKLTQDRLIDQHMGMFFNNNLYIPYQDGSIKMKNIDVDLETIFENAIDTAMAEEIRLQNPTEPLNISIQPLGPCIVTTIFNGRLKTEGIYDLIKHKILISEPYLFKFEQLEVMPLQSNNDQYNFFFKRMPLNVSSAKPERPAYPEAQDYTSMNPKDVKKATKEFDTKAAIYENQLLIYETNYSAYYEPSKIKTTIYTNFECTKELFSINGAKSIFIDGGYIIAELDHKTEIYDISTKSMFTTFIHTP